MSFCADTMERLHLDNPNDAEVDALLSQLADESLMKSVLNTHTTSSRGFEYPTFTDRWSSAEDDAGALDSNLANRFASLKLPIPSKKKGKELEAVKKGKDSGIAKKGKDSGIVKKGKDSGIVKKGRDAGVRNKAKESDAVTAAKDAAVVKKARETAKEGEEFLRESRPGEADSRHNREMSRSLSQRTEFLSFRSDDLDLADSLDTDLNERLRALKAPPSPATARNAGLDNLLQFSGQLSAQDYEGYGSSASIPSSPHANLLGRSKARSCPRVISTSVSSSCYCSAPSPLKLLKQASSKSFPSKPAALPPLSPSPITDRPPVKKSGKECKVKGLRNLKLLGDETGKKKQDRRRGTVEENLVTVEDVERLLSSVAGRVGLETSTASSTEEDDPLRHDLHAWSVLRRDEEFEKALSEERKLNREAERVVEWAKDAARLGIDFSDVDSEAEDLELGEDDRDSDDVRETRFASDNSPKALKAKKKWGLF